MLPMGVLGGQHLMRSVRELVVVLEDDRASTVPSELSCIPNTSRKGYNYSPDKFPSQKYLIYLLLLTYLYLTVKLSPAMCLFHAPGLQNFGTAVDSCCDKVPLEGVSTCSTQTPKYLPLSSLLPLCAFTFTFPSAQPSFPRNLPRYHVAAGSIP